MPFPSRGPSGRNGWRKRKTQGVALGLYLRFERLACFAGRHASNRVTGLATGHPARLESAPGHEPLSSTLVRTVAGNWIHQFEPLPEPGGAIRRELESQA